MPSPSQPNPDPTIHGDVRVRIGAPQIWRVEFQRQDTVSEQEGHQEGRSGNPELGLGIQRWSHDTIGVQLSAKIEDVEMISSRIDCRLELSIIPVDKEREVDFDRELRYAAARVAPVIMYPYIRETIMGLSLKAGLEPVVMPVINVAALFDPEELDVSPFSEEDEESSKAELVDSNDQ